MAETVGIEEGEKTDMYLEKDFLALSGIQHFSFCERQWALIHIEQQWNENLLTVLGDLVHKRAHDEAIRERRGDTLVVRGLGVHSFKLGLTGKCDVVEFREDENGFPLQGEEGMWRAIPVEYKRGKSKQYDADRLQLCAQAICLEEMFCCEIKTGYLYYNETHSRERVELDSSLRATVQEISAKMHELFSRRWTPAAMKKQACRSCSLEALCVPQTVKKESVGAYFDRKLGGMYEETS